MNKLWEMIFGNTFAKLLMPISLQADGDGDGGGGGGDGDGGGGGTDTAWHANVPEALRETGLVTESKDEDTFWKRVADQQTYAGQSIRIPSKEAGEADWKKFNDKMIAKVPTLMPTPDYENDESLEGVYTKMGRPEKYEGYENPELGETVDKSRVEAFKPIAHKFGLSKKQFKGVSKAVSELDQARMVEGANAAKAEHEALKVELGATYTSTMERVKNFMKMSKAPEDLASALASEYSKPGVVKWFHEIASKLMGEGKAYSGDAGAGDPNILTPAEASERISEMMNNKDSDYWHPNKPGYAEAKARMRQLRLWQNPKTGAQSVTGFGGV